jgi:hypothetical protein
MSADAREANDSLKADDALSDFRRGRIDYYDLVGELTPLIGYDSAVERAKEAEAARFSDEANA